jgi:transcriptional regulator with XRE-family HTH domain
MNMSYTQICSGLLEKLPERQKTVLGRRFSLLSESGKIKGDTLEAIGKDFGVTRERVRQIESDAFSLLKPETKNLQKIFQYFKQVLKNKGGIYREDLLLGELGGEKEKKQVNFLLSLSPDFRKFSESPDFNSFWALESNALNTVKKNVSALVSELKKHKKPVLIKDFKESRKIGNALVSYLDISKKIQKNSEGLWGLKDWPEINPRGVKNKAFLVFKKEQKPLHFTAVAQLIGSALPQTVHNELIKDPRFVLVGRGLYALKEWGYEEGAVKDVIAKILKASHKPLTKEEILEKTLKQRLVKENTVLLNLNNRKYFFKSGEGYTVQES